MDKIAYAGIVVVVVIIVGAVLLSGVLGSPQPVGTTATTSASTSKSTINNVSYNTTTLSVTPSCSNFPGYLCPAVSCTPYNSTFGCTNATYIYSPSNGTTYLWVTVAQYTGQEWSSFGLAFVPQGTPFSQGTPFNVTYNVADYKSTGNVGTILQSGSNATVRADNGLKGSGYNSSINGTVWACYANSGILYVGIGCTTSGGQPATYVEIGKIRTA